MFTNHLGTLKKSGLYKPTCKYKTMSSIRFGELEDQGCPQFANLNKQHPPVLSPVSFGCLPAWWLMVVVVVSKYLKLSFASPLKGVKEFNLLLTMYYYIYICTVPDIILTTIENYLPFLTMPRYFSCNFAK